MADKPKISNYLAEDKRGLQFPMSREQFQSLSPATQSSVMQAMSQVDDKGRPLLSYSDYITDSQMSAVTSKAPKKEVYVPSGSASMVDPDTGDQYSMTGASLQQLMMRRKRQGLPDLISLDEYKKQRKAANEKLSKEVTDMLPDGAELMIPAAKAEEAKQAEEDKINDPYGEEPKESASPLDTAPVDDFDPVGDEPSETKEEDVPVLSEEEKETSSAADIEQLRVESDVDDGDASEARQQDTVARMLEREDELDQLKMIIEAEQEQEAAKVRADAAFTDSPKTSKRMSDAEVEQLYSAIFQDNAIEQNEELANEFAKLLRSLPSGSDVDDVKKALLKSKQFAPLLEA